MSCIWNSALSDCYVCPLKRNWDTVLLWTITSWLLSLTIPYFLKILWPSLDYKMPMAKMASLMLRKPFLVLFLWGLPILSLIELLFNTNLLWVWLVSSLSPQGSAHSQSTLKKLQSWGAIWNMMAHLDSLATHWGQSSRKVLLRGKFVSFPLLNLTGTIIILYEISRRTNKCLITRIVHSRGHGSWVTHQDGLNTIFS